MNQTSTNATIAQLDGDIFNLNLKLLIISFLIYILNTFTVIDYLVGKLICLALKIKFKDTISIRLASAQISLLWCSLKIHNLQLCVKDFCHMDIENVIIKLSNFKLSDIKYKQSNIYGSISTYQNKLFYADLNNARIILVNENILNATNNNNDILIYFILDNIILNINRLTICLNHMNKNVSSVLTARRSIILGHRFENKNEIKSLLINAIDVKFAFIQMFQSVKLNSNTSYFLYFNEMKLQISIVSLLDKKYSDDENIYPSVFVEFYCKKRLELNIDLWNDCIFNFLSSTFESNESFFIRCHLLGYNEVILSRLDDKLFRLKSEMKSKYSNCSKIELMHVNSNNRMLKLNLKFFTIQSHLSAYFPFICHFNSIDVLASELTEKLNFKIRSTDETTLSISNIMANVNILELILDRLNIFKNKETIVDANAFNFLAQLPSDNSDLTFNKTIFRSEQVSLKAVLYHSSTSKFLITFKYAEIFSLNRFKFKAKLERLVIESILNEDETKFQFIISPIIFNDYYEFVHQKVLIEQKCDNRSLNGSNQSLLFSYIANETANELENKSTEKKLLINSSSIYLSVMQLRYQSLKNDNQVYSRQLELLVGDVFGTIDLTGLISLVDLIESVMSFVSQELIIQCLLPSNRTVHSYSSFRILTSLTQINFLFDFKGSKKCLVNLTTSPIHYGSCDFHWENKNSGYLLTLTDIYLKFLTSVDDPQNDEDLNLKEIGRFFVNHVSVYRSIQSEHWSKKLEHLRSKDSTSKRLWFLWDSNQRGGCLCSEHLDFFLNQTKLYDFSGDYVVKPCIYPKLTNLDNKTSFGMSILVLNEIIFYSYRKFLAEDTKCVTKRNNRHFLVLCYIENNNLNFKSKFEPFEINVYDDDMETFVADDITNLSDSNINFNTSLMSPPYFSTDFSIYVRYLPVIKNISTINYKPHKAAFTSKFIYKDELSDYTKEFSIPPYSDIISGQFLKLTEKTLAEEDSFKSLTVLSNIYDASSSCQSIDDYFLTSSNQSNDSRGSSSVLIKSYDANDIQANKSNKFNSNHEMLINFSKRNEKSISQMVSYNLNSNKIYVDLRSESMNKIIKKKPCIQQIFVRSIHSDNEIFAFSTKKSTREVTSKTKLANSKTESSHDHFSWKSSDIYIDIMFTYLNLISHSIDCFSNLIELVQTNQTNSKTWSELNRIENSRTWQRVILFRSLDIDFIYSPCQAVKIKLNKLKLGEMPNNILIDELIIDEIELNNMQCLLKNSYNQIKLLCLSLLNLMRFRAQLKLRINDSKIFGTRFELTHMELNINDSISNLIEISLQVNGIKSLDEIRVEQISNLINLFLNLIILNKKFLFDCSSSKSKLIKKFKLKINLSDVDIRLGLLKENKKHISSHWHLIINSIEYIVDRKLDINDFILRFIFSLSLMNENEVDNKLVSFAFNLNKLILDANLKVELTFNSMPLLGAFHYTFILPLVFKSTFEIDNEEMSWLRLQLPSVMSCLMYGDKCYQLFEFESIQIFLSKLETSVLVKCERIRLIRSFLPVNLFNLMSNVLGNEMCSKGYQIRFETKSLIWCYFPENFEGNKWIFLRLNELKLSYSFDSVENELNESLKCEFRNLDETSLDKNILLQISTIDESIFKKFDFNKWLDYSCMSKPDQKYYQFKLIAKLASVVELDLKCVTLTSSSSMQKIQGFYYLNSSNNELRIAVDKSKSLNVNIIKQMLVEMSSKLAKLDASYAKRSELLSKSNSTNESKLANDNEASAYFDSNDTERLSLLLHHFLFTKLLSLSKMLKRI